MAPSYLEFLIANPFENINAFLHSKIARRMLIAQFHEIIIANRNHPKIREIKLLQLLIMQQQTVQALKATKSRVKLVSGATIRDLVSHLVCKPEMRECGPLELWGHLYALLDAEPASPKEFPDKRDHKKSYYTYEWVGADRRKLTFSRFANLVRDVRRKMAH